MEDRSRRESDRQYVMNKIREVNSTLEKVEDVNKEWEFISDEKLEQLLSLLADMVMQINQGEEKLL